MPDVKGWNLLILLGFDILRRLVCKINFEWINFRVFEVFGEYTKMFPCKISLILCEN